MRICAQSSLRIGGCEYGFILQIYFFRMKFSSSLFVSLLFLFFLSPPTVEAAYYRSDVGLNVHWALGGFGKDDVFRSILQESHTKWAREHFYNEVLMGENQTGWLERYDSVMEEYKDLGVNVVGMLAYGKTHGDRSVPPKEEWEDFVEMVVRRYGKQVKVWEVWNEPDSPDFLQPNTPEAYAPILDRTYRVIKRIDPDATVLVGGLASPNADFLEALYTNKKTRDRFDGVAFHVYSCGLGHQNTLRAQLDRVQSVIQKYHPEHEAWITEVGCSTGVVGMTETKAAAYLDEVNEILFSYPFVKRSFVYTITNRSDLDNYENNFGLFDVSLVPRKQWSWYKEIFIGPYNKVRLPKDVVEKKARVLKKKLEGYFGKGKIPLDAKYWPRYVDAYVYGGYSVQAIAQGIRFQGATVHPEIGFEAWQSSPSYKTYIKKGLTKSQQHIAYAYGQARLDAADEAKKARKLDALLEDRFGEYRTGVDADNWALLVNAYVYGGYPLDALARYAVSGGKTVSAILPWRVYRTFDEYRAGIKLELRKK